MLDPQTQDALRLALDKRPANEFPWKRLMNLLAPSYTITSFRALFRYHGYRKISFLSECLLTRLNIYVAPSKHFSFFYFI